MPSVWNKYKKEKELSSTQHIKTFLASFQPIIKEIMPKDKESLFEIYEYFDNMKEELKIYEIFYEDGKIYLVLGNDEDINKRIDDIISKNEYKDKKECILEGQNGPITKEEIFKLFELEKCMCKIDFEGIVKNKKKNINGTGFFCEIENKNLPMKYCLFTNNHVFNEENIQLIKKIKFEYYTKPFLRGAKYEEREIKLTPDRKVFTNKELDYTCIEIFEWDNI